MKALKLKIKLTPELKKSLEERGAHDPNLFEARGSARFRCNATGTATLLKSPLRVPFQDVESMVIVRNISRSGVGFISHQQWFPDQEIKIILATGTIQGFIARARRIDINCYDVGIEIAKFEQNAASSSTKRA